MFTIEPSSTSDGFCDCCGQTSRHVRGLAFADNRPCASYFVDWTLAHVVERGAKWRLVLGDWGEGASAADRYVVRLAYRLIDGTPSYMVVDASCDAFAGLADHALRRTDVIGTPFAPQVFALCDAILAQDARLQPLAAPSAL